MNNIDLDSRAGRHYSGTAESKQELVRGAEITDGRGAQLGQEERKF
ncbi:hypothetical protein E2C01_093590 [Portunus trituberculatus]|uniref:Uncharacterized protein n=1 Tax=Portunus trituberculatus TaxID=210409 RepID=A0A5B7JJJ5_PORTR|nr:hypothetical protein [Portunus trituberculatus]